MCLYFQFDSICGFSEFVWNSTFYRSIPLASMARWIPRWTLNPYILGSNLGNCIFFFYLTLLLQCKFSITVSTQIILLYYPLWCPGLQRLQRFDFFSLWQILEIICFHTCVNARADSRQMHKCGSTCASKVLSQYLLSFQHDHSNLKYLLLLWSLRLTYRKNSKYWDMYVWANSVDSQSDQNLHCLPFFLHLLEA